MNPAEGHAPALGRVSAYRGLEFIPRGGTLPPALWQRRHRWILAVLWLHAIGSAVFGVVTGAELLHSLGEASLIGLSAVAAQMMWWHRRTAAVLASFGLVTSAALLVHFSGGYIELHFHFFVVLGVIALYQDWLPFLVAIGYVVVHHSVAGVLAPASVYNHPSAWAHPWLWAGVHGAFVAAMSVVLLVSWVVNERSDAALRAAEAQYRAIFERASEGIFQIGLDGRFLTVNPALARILGYTSPQELLGDPTAADRRQYVDASRGAQLIAQLDAEGAVTGFTSRLRRADGVEIWVSENAHAARDDRGRTLYYEGSLQDVTVREEADRMKADFVSFVTHQLRTPLSGIKWMLELADTADELPEDTRSCIRDARESAARLTHLVNRMLDVSRVERGLDVVLEATSLATVTANVMDEMLPRAREREHRVSVTGTDHLPPVLADPQLLREVIANLVGNAIKYTPVGGRITIGMTPSATAVQWSVSDSGIGIPLEAQPRLFEKFFRADNARKVETEGTGLGLSLARLIVERLGGRLSFDSQVGRGATFTFTVPRADGVHASTRPALPAISIS